MKVLGLLFQFRHSWLPHIKSTKVKCMQALNILVILTHPSHGCNRKILLPLYTTLTRAILDYGSPIYGLVPSSQLKLLDPIQNSALRLVTGAFRTNPVSSLCADTGIPPLHYRRLTLTAKFVTSILQHPQTTFNHVFHLLHNLHPDHNLQIHLQRQLNHSFKFRSLNPFLSTVPPWFVPLLWSTSHSLNILNPQCHLQATKDFQEINSFKKSTICFTDGSKIHNRSGFAYSIGNSIYSHRHRNSASVYTPQNCKQSANAPSRYSLFLTPQSITLS